MVEASVLLPHEVFGELYRGGAPQVGFKHRLYHCSMFPPNATYEKYVRQSLQYRIRVSDSYVESNGSKYQIMRFHSKPCAVSIYHVWRQQWRIHTEILATCQNLG